MPRPTKTDIKKEKLLEALEKSLGVVTTACRSVPINRSTFYDWYNDDKEFAKRVDSIGEIALDFAESKLHKNIEKGKEVSILFYLKTKGKSRGYVEKKELDHKGLENITITRKVIDGNEGD